MSNYTAAPSQVRAAQLTPTVSYWLVANQVVFAKVISLGSYTPPSNGPGNGWQSHIEHWFISKQLPQGGLAALLEGSSEVEIFPKHAAPAQLTQALIGDADSCLDTNKWTFAWYGKGSMSSNDWQANGTPPQSNTAYYFAQQDAPYPPRRAQVVFEVDDKDPTKLATVSWITDEIHSGFYCGMKLTKGAMPPSWPYYYTLP